MSPRHLSLGERPRYDGPVVSGPASWWCWLAVLSSGGIAVAAFAAATIVTFAVDGGRGLDQPWRTGAAVLFPVLFLTGGVAGVLFAVQLNRERSRGYVTVDWSWMHLENVVVGAVSRRIRHERGSLDADAARRRAPWAAASTASPSVAPADASRGRPAGWTAFAAGGPLLMLLARLVDPNHSSTEKAVAAGIGFGFVVALLVGMWLWLRFSIRRMDRLAIRLTESRPALVTMLGLRSFGAIAAAARCGTRVPFFVVVAFAEGGVEFWGVRSELQPVGRIPLADVLDIVPGSWSRQATLSIIAIPKDGRSSIGFDFTPLNASHPLAPVSFEAVRGVRDRAVALWRPSAGEAERPGP